MSYINSTIQITSAFDGGNIDVLDMTDETAIRLAIRKDHLSEFYQWFYFRATGALDKAVTYHIENAGGSSYTAGWETYQAVASYDRETWFRVPTTYENGRLSIAITAEQDSIWVAYFAPYSMERHHDLVALASQHPDVRVQSAGLTLDGQTIDVLHVGNPGDVNKRHYWITARQHPGETMAEWWIEGFIDRLLDEADPVARVLRDKAVFHIVPNMNPDGSKRGHLRTNAAGINLNREWNIASLDKSPEVYHVLQMMTHTGVDFALDVHGDEALPYNFIAGAEGVPSYDDKSAKLQETFLNAYKIASPDFQTRYGYPVNKPGTANLALCTNYIAETWKCLAMTLEMPFKDNADLPDENLGWSPARCQALGAASLDPMLAVADILR